MKPTLTPEGRYQYDYPHAAITADCVIFGFDGHGLKLLLIERGGEPFKGMWALPGGFMRVNDLKGGPEDRSIEDTAKRELFEETGLKDIFMEQFKVFSRVGRDPRERVVTVAFIGMVRPEDYRLLAGDDAASAMWWNLDALPPVAFDHLDIIKEARAYLAEMIRIRPIAFNLLEKSFTMPELQKVYEAITGVTYDRRNFQRKALQSSLIVPADDDNSDTRDNLSLTEDPEDSAIEISGVAMRSSSPPMASLSCCASPLYAREPSEDIPQRHSRSRKLFSFRKKKKAADDDSSIKDIFNF